MAKLANTTINGTLKVTGATVLLTPLPIASGGTGATTATGAISNLGIADYIVESDTSGIWTYEKWASGKAVCWGTYTGDITPYADYNYLIPALTYPFTFIDSPIDNVSVKAGNGNGYETRSYGYTDHFECVITSNLNTTINITARIYVIGKWK